MSYEEKKIDHVGLFIYVSVFFLTFVVSYKEGIAARSDFQVHEALASRISLHNIMSTLYIYPVWHILVALTTKLVTADYQYAGALIAACFNVVTVVITRNILIRELCDKISYAGINIITVMTVFITPIYVPWFNIQPILGQGSPTIWHNPTSNAVKPFAITIIYLFVLYYRKFRIDMNGGLKYLIGIGILTAVSCLVKPSFVQGFIPALGLFLAVEMIVTRSCALSLYCRLAIALIPTALIVGTQAYLLLRYNVGDDRSGISISFLKIWQRYTPNVAISVLIAVAFPLYIVLLNMKNIFENKLMLFSVVLYIVCFFEFALLVETGLRERDGNFGWAYALALFVFFIATIIRFVEMCSMNDKNRKANKAFLQFGSILLLMHFMCGVYYYVICVSA
ncbi:MAG: hypothetical protein PHU25_04000 [Deltaproteobacteria bacterium]|nr:hypothetical protein [Deltaproteobacteria bacterium]